MRISTAMIFDNGVSAMQKQTSALLHTQEQISSGSKLLTPSDNPVAAAQALQITQAQALDTQYTSAQGDATTTLGLMDNQLSSANDLISSVRTLAVQAGNSTLTNSDRASIATQLRSDFSQLMGIANSTNGSGQYLFSGYEGGTQPFSGSVADGVVYQGDNGQRTLQVSSGVNLAVSNSGNDVFMNVKTGNGMTVTGTQTQQSANAQTVTVDNTNVTGSIPLSSANLQLKFWIQGSAAGSVDLSTGVAITSSNNTFQVSLNGGAAQTVTLPTGFTMDNSSASLQKVQTALDSALGTGNATAAFDSNNHLVIKSDTPNAGSSVTLGGNSAILGTPTSSSTTYYDIVDTKSGDSIFTGNTSATGSSGSYTHTYTSGVPITLTGTASPFNNDYGGTVSITGAPQTGDTFAITVGGSSITATATTLAATGARASIDKGTVTDPVKWTSSANSGNLELRFWVDTANVMGNGAGKTYYDLVDASTGKSLFTGNASTTGASGSYTHQYTSGQAISLSSSGSPAFDYGAQVTVSGIPATGDVFTIKSSSDASGNGYFVTAPKEVAASNTGTGTIGTASVTNPAAWNSSANSGKLEIRFWNDTSTSPPTLYYDLVDATTNKSLFTDSTSTAGGTNNTYTHKFTAGDAISFSGLNSAYKDFGVSVTINGTPASGDVFTLDKSTNQSAFTTLGSLINTLESPPVASAAGQAAFANQINTAINNISQIQDNILRVRSEVGARMNEVTSLGTVIQNDSLQNSTTLSNLTDVDYTKAVTALSQQQIQLQAAQLSFSKISQLSLFNYL